MKKSRSITLLFVVSVLASLILATLFWLRQQPWLYVELVDSPLNSSILFNTVSGPSFTIHDILVDDVFRPTLTSGKPGRVEMRSELTYPIAMTPPASIPAILRLIDTGDSEIQQRCYGKPPRFVFIRTSHGNYRIPLTPNKMKTVILHR